MTKNAPSTDDLEGLIRSFEHDGYEVRIYVSQTASGLLIGHVDVRERGVHKCRIVLTGHHSHGTAIVALEGKCKEWIAARVRGHSDGETTFDRI